MFVVREILKLSNWQMFHLARVVWLGVEVSIKLYYANNFPDRPFRYLLSHLNLKLGRIPRPWNWQKGRSGIFFNVPDQTFRNPRLCHKSEKP